tara:strand:- start:15 stop:215 length:201 start_codon:yes stop_codon:yes gene_type:complete
MKIGDLVQFTYGRVGGQIERIGIFAERGYYGIHKVISEDKAYWVPKACIKPISMQRKDDVNDNQVN